MIVIGRMTVWSKSKTLVSVSKLLLNASSAIEVNVSGIVLEVLSSERRWIASKMVKTVILKEERMGENVVLVITQRNR